ncbi:Splicing factor 45 [Trichinella zimbabwensis]|uniref:Splicing factor 45 n=1 Tax=Trichinella zimbabwensis TaxID=268475 RepID=A0A0V1H134_9BILA|nr:Splicing factor 45 [Trichinella zimbabwensis]
MSLYDDESWKKNLKLLKAHMQLKRVAAMQKIRPPSSDEHHQGMSSRRSGEHVAANKNNASSVHSAMPLSLAKQQAVTVHDEWRVEDEYDPNRPNEFANLVMFRDNARSQFGPISKSYTRRSVVEKVNYNSSGDEVGEEEKPIGKWNSIGERTERWRSSGAAIAPPPELIEQDKQTVVVSESETSDSSFMPPPPPPPASSARGLDFAARIMERYGYKQGSGLGRDEQGMSTALQVEKVGTRHGKIIHESSSVATSSTEVNVTDELRNPTKVMLLRNMVGAGEVDSELQPEVHDEMLKYGEVRRCMVVEVPNASDMDAVRIFVEFARVEQAIKAVVALNGRFFAGRSVMASFYDPEKFARLELY